MALGQEATAFGHLPGRSDPWLSGEKTKRGWENPMKNGGFFGWTIWDILMKHWRFIADL